MMLGSKPGHYRVSRIAVTAHIGANHARHTPAERRRAEEMATVVRTFVATHNPSVIRCNAWDAQRMR